ncbi:hypothetical protein L2E82_08314 [Cichorium intybus]|uniref:Uncharacterized protein n=1 Tax=Cichorium intybus TaxID=13427 RepID=A0ACB9G793_CICIN|nr:hypothetical protein L2E82_08314 [Cichorium intybus]
MNIAGILAGIFLLLALYCGVYTFRHSAIADFPDFDSVKVEMPQWFEVPTDKDTQNLLQKSEIKFLNQIQGPESVAFDLQGRGPYTRIADGRVVIPLPSPPQRLGSATEDPGEVFKRNAINKLVETVHIDVEHLRKKREVEMESMFTAQTVLRQREEEVLKGLREMQQILMGNLAKKGVSELQPGHRQECLSSVKDIAGNRVPSDDPNATTSAHTIVSCNFVFVYSLHLYW